MIESKKMPISALIPARSGSKRIKAKNIQKLGEHPLLAFPILTAVASEKIDRVYLSSDSKEYLRIGAEYGATKITRPAAMASDIAGDAEVINHAFASNVMTPKPSLIVYLRPTTPFRSVHVVDKAIDRMIELYDACDSMRSVEEIPESIDKLFWAGHGELTPISTESVDAAGDPNQQCRPVWKGNGYVDIVKPKYFQHAGKLWGRCYPYLTPHTPEIDTPEELDFCRWKMYTGRGEDYDLFARCRLGG